MLPLFYKKKIKIYSIKKSTKINRKFEMPLFIVKYKGVLLKLEYLYRAYRKSFTSIQKSSYKLER